MAKPEGMIKTGPRLFSSLVRRGQLRIGARLTLCFLAIVLLMLAASVVVLWEFHQSAAAGDRLNRADQVSLAAVTVHLDIDTLKNRLAALADTHDGPEFAREAAALRQTFMADVPHARQLFRESAEIESDPLILSTLETVQVTLPSQVDSVMGLAAVDDWPAVRLRLEDQVQGLMDLSSLLVERVERAVSLQRAEAIASAEQARRQLFIVLPATALLTMLMAVVLGWRVTRTITEPLTQLSAGAQALGHGDFDHEVEVTGEDELATLGAAFNYAARRLRELYEGLRNSEEQWRAAFESNPTMYFMLDRAGIMLSVNLFGAEKLGYELDELIGNQVLDTFYEPDRDDVCKHAQECFNQPGRMMGWEARKIRKDGTMLWVRETANAILLKNRPVLLVVCEDITEQKRAEEAARRSEAELRALIENIPAMVFIALPGPLSEFVSRGWRDYTGLSAEETVGTGWHSAVHPDDLARHIEKYRVCSISGEPFEDETRYRRAADGEYRWFLVRAVPMHDESGRVVKWYGVLTDIEDRKRAESLLAGEKRVLELVARGNPLPEILDTLCRLVEEQDNGALASILLVEGDRLKCGGAPSLPKAYTDAIDGVLIGPCAGSCGTAAYRGEQIIVEDIATDPLWADYRKAALPHSLLACWSTPVLSSQGKVIATFAMYYREIRRPSQRDQEMIEQITHLAGVAIERKLTYDQLQRSEAYLSEAQKLTHTGSWAYRAGKGPVFWSEENLRIWGFDPGRGAPDIERVHQRIHPGDRDEVVSHAEGAVRAKKNFAQEFRIVLPDGAVRYIHAVGHPVVGADGAVIEVVGTHVDITERKRAEEERERLRKLESDLAHINRVSMMGELAVSLSHELKQPIAASITNANSCLRWLLRDSPDIGEARDALMRIVQDGNRAADIINRLRSFYRKGAPAEPELVDVNEIIREMLTLLRSEADRYSIPMRTDLASGLPRVAADRVQLQQVFLNLMLNGIEAMQDTGGELTISSQIGDDGRLLVSVRDTGVGLPVEKADQIFNAFFTTKPQGSGMGLAISRSIVESHGGHLWASANTTRGATFHFSLPTTANEVKAAARAT